MKRSPHDRLRMTKALTAGLALVSGLVIGLPVQAALMNFGNLPLFLGSTSKPNIFFIIDDSGSMDWEVMTRDFANGGRFTGSQPDGTSPGSAGGVTHRDANNSGTANCGFGSGSFFGYLYGVEFASNTYGDDGNDCNTADDESWRFRSNAFNPLYFDPNANYVPWAGTDADGDTFANIDVEDAPDNPFLTDASQRRIDLTEHDSNWRGGFNNRGTSDRDGDGDPDGFRYYDYTDTDGDGNFDNGEQTERKIDDQSSSIQQNFANWFSYYRSREFVAKAAYGQLIAGASNVRMGLVTLHNNNSVNIAIADMNDDPAVGYKKALLDKLYRIHSNNGTPLRNSLKKAGLYLECASGGYFSSCPASSIADGGSCQQNFAVLMTDGFYNGGSPSIPNADGDNNTGFDGGAYGDPRSNTLADVAMHFYERDLQTGLDDQVPTIPSIDEANHQHMVTYGVAFGVVGNLTSMPTDNTTAFAWPNPFSGTTAQRNANRIDDLRHAAYNGRGQFLSAQNPQELIDALEQALGDIGNRVGSAAAVALNSASLNTDSTLYQARFDTADWSGQLLSFPINSDGSIGTLNWDAGAVIETQDFDTGRNIITMRDDTRAAVAFRFANLSPAQQNALHDDPTTTAVDNDGEGASRLLFLRGDDSNEATGLNYRDRSSKLGDLVHSAPFFAGPPGFNYPDALETKAYSAFVASNASRTPVVYVGANDGMLHAFNSTNGQELLAYVPTGVYNRLSQLTDPAYSHEYYVDGTPTVGDAFINNNWATVVATPLRTGAQGLFALDVTSPSTFTEANANNIVLWEFTDQDDADVGFVVGRISIVRMANGKWAAVFGNGYNNSEADGNASTTGHAVLYILYIEDGDDGTWAATDFVKIDTEQGSVATPNGLSSPSPIDVNGDAIVDYIYAGDLEGNMWKFDVTSSNPGNWKVAYTSGSAPQPLFTACESLPCTSTNRQPITTRPEVGLHPSGEPGFVVYFGTGKYLETGDNAATGQLTQSFYGLWDKNEASLTAFNRSHLLEQEIISEEVEGFDTDDDGTDDVTITARLTSDNPLTWHTATGNPTGTPKTSYLGWYMDLFNTDKGANTDNFGERQVSDPILRNGRIIFTTLLPSTNTCTFGGDGFLMELDAADGSRLAFSPFDLNADGEFNEEDYIQASFDADGDGINDLLPASGKKSEVGIITTPTILSDNNIEYKFASGSTGGIDTTTENPGPGNAGRQSWKQLR